MASTDQLQSMICTSGLDKHEEATASGDYEGEGREVERRARVGKSRVRGARIRKARVL